MVVNRRRVNRAVIYDSLRNEIESGVLAPGEFVREIEIAERFGVSRTPVRETLSRLELERILQRDGRGLRVRVADENEAVQVYNLRELLEAEAAAQAAEARNAGDLVVLERLTARDHSLKDPDDATRRVTNLEFHAAIWAASHNAPLTDLLSRLAWHVPRTLRSTLSAPGRWADALDEHARIVEAIVARDSELARSLTRSHMNAAGLILLQQLRDVLGR